MANEHETPQADSPTKPPLAVRRPQSVDAEPVEPEGDVSRIETLLASLQPRD